MSFPCNKAFTLEIGAAIYEWSAALGSTSYSPPTKALSVCSYTHTEGLGSGLSGSFSQAFGGKAVSGFGTTGNYQAQNWVKFSVLLCNSGNTSVAYKLHLTGSWLAIGCFGTNIPSGSAGFGIGPTAGSTAYANGGEVNGTDSDSFDVTTANLITLPAHTSATFEFYVSVTLAFQILGDNAAMTCTTGCPSLITLSGTYELI